MREIIIGIDPSIVQCGMAIFVKNNKKFVLLKVLKQPNKGITDPWEKANEIKGQIWRIIKNVVQDDVKLSIVLEVPDYWALPGLESRESWSLMKLQSLCGMIYGLYPRRTTVIIPRMWKGNLTKDITRTRIIKKVNLEKISFTHEINLETLNHNALDAVGIVLWAAYFKI